MSRRFNARLIPTLATVLALGLLLTLGTWQSFRYQEKLADEATRNDRAHLPIIELKSIQDIQPDLDHRIATVKGHLDQNHNFLIKHRILNGKPGFWLINALIIDGTDDTLLINRGWLPYPQGRELVHTLSTPSHTVEFSGLVHFPSRVIADTAQRENLAANTVTKTPGLIELESYDLVAINHVLGLSETTPPVVLTLGDDFSGQPYPIASFDHVTSIYLTSEKHLGYALTWYTLAFCLVAMYLAAGFGLLRSEKFH